MRLVTLLSAGLDSVVATVAASREHEIVLALTFDYGQHAAGREKAAAIQVAQALGINHSVIALPWLAEITNSALVAEAEQMIAADAASLDDPQAVSAVAQAVWVPNRNGIFLNIAAGYCEARDCAGIVCGFNAEEAASFSDNSREFMQAAEECFAYSTRHGLQVISPTVALTKAQIVEVGYEIGAPLHLIWSCYLGGQTHCWSCPSCVRLRRALESSGYWERWQRQALRLLSSHPRE